MLDEKTHTYIIDGLVYESVTTILKKEGFVGWLPADDYYARFGTAVHNIIKMLSAGMKIKVPLIYRPFIEQWLKFKRETKMRIIAFEQEVHHPLFKFAGMYDLLCEINGEIWLIDYKRTNCNGLMWHELQTAGYALCLALKGGKYANVRRGTLLLRENNYKFVVHEKIQNPLQKFASIAMAYQVKKELKVYKDDKDEEDNLEDL